MCAGISKPLTFLVIGVLIVALIYSSSSRYFAFAVPNDPRFHSASDCKGGVSSGGTATLTCCWREQVPGSALGEVYCQRCFLSDDGTPSDCDPKELQMRPLPEGDLPQLETAPPIRGLPSGGDLPTLEQVPRGLPSGGDVPTLEQGPGEPTLPVVCSEEAGLEKDPETGQCVPIESPATDEQQPEEPEEEQQQPEEEEEQSEPEEEQSSEESDSGDESNN